MNAATQPVKYAHMTTKRGRTRKKLITAARDLIYNKGIENISIQDVTEAAGLATGSFYNYFENKSAIIQAIIEDFDNLFATCLNQTRAKLNDPAMRLSVTLKYYFTQALENEAWRSFIISAGLSDTHILVQNSKECREDISAGKKGGRFRSENVSITQSLITGMATYVTLEIQRGKLAKSAINETVRHVLRMLGLPDIAAKAFAEAPLPDISAPVREDLPADENIPFRITVDRRSLSRDIQLTRIPEQRETN
jgi:AcrR family transcriptional regulator